MQIRNQILYFCFMILLISCDEKQKSYSMAEQMQIDSIKTRLEDSINEIVRMGEPTHVKNLQDTVYAYGKIKFGMPEREYNKLPKKETEYFHKIGEFQYFLHTRFNENTQLYMVTFQGFSKTANYIDNEVLNSMNNLIDVITKKYGTPEILGHYPTIYDFQPGYIRFTRQWTIGTKIIKVGAAEESSGSEYYPVCWIYNKPLYEAEETGNENALNNQKQEDASRF